MSDVTRLPAIPTRYAGHHFRSRLEARWAVFFDHLGIEWQYEPEGFELPWRLSARDGKIRYLPDFWLPQFRQWVEVKGAITDPELDQLLNAAAALSAPHGGCGDGGDVVICGPIPRVDASAVIGWPAVLHMHKGDLMVDNWGGKGHGPAAVTIARDVGGDPYGEVDMDLGRIRSMLLERRARTPLRGNPVARKVAKAFVAASSARFEHGQSGAT